VYKFLCGQKFSFGLVIYLGVGRLDQVATPFNILKTGQIVTQGGQKILRPTSNAWGLQFPHILTSRPRGTEWHLAVVWVWFPYGKWAPASLPVFMDICISSSEMSFQTLSPISNWAFLLLLQDFSVYLRPKSLVRYMIAKTPSHSVGCLFTFLIASLQHKSFNFEEIQSL
jgi:hypothetical protein